MTEETRKDMVRVLKEKLEEVRVSIRNAREEEKKKIDTEKKAGTLTEDEQRNQIEDLDKKTKDIISNLESLADEKEKEVMTI